MTQVAKMILNELPISPTINEKIELIKSSKLDFKDFNSFRFLLNSLESFEPNSKLSPNEYKAQINKRIGAFLEKLNILEEKIKSTQNLQTKQELKPNETSNKDGNKEYSLSDRAKFFYLLAEIETFTSKDMQNLQTLGELLERTSELLLNAKNLNEIEIDTLEETKEFLQGYFIYLKQKESLKALSTNDIASCKQAIYDLLSKNIADPYPYNEMKEYDKHCIIFDKSMNIQLALQFKRELENLDLKVKFLEDDSTSIPNDKRYILIFGNNEESVLNAYGTLLDTEYYSVIDNDLLKESTIKELQNNEITQNVSNESQKDLPQSNINFDDSNPRHTIKASLFDDEEVKPQKKRMN